MTGPLPAALAVGGLPVPREPLLDGERLFWLEQRPRERGRTTLLLRPRPGAAAIELTPGPWNLRSRVHAYGGGVVAVGGDTVVFVHDGDGCLWSLDLGDLGETGAPLPIPRRLTPPPEGAGEARAFADGRIDLPRRRWIGVMESGGRDLLVAVPLEGGEPRVIHSPADFCGYAVPGPDGDTLAWVEWRQPCLPWERSQLWIGRFGADGAVEAARPVAGSLPGEGPGVSVFQPLWLGDDLVVANDRSGWWNLERLPQAVALARSGPAQDTGTGEPLAWEPLLPMEAEFATPQWTYGLRTTAPAEQGLVAAACRGGRWEIGRVILARASSAPTAGEVPAAAAGSRWEPLPLPFDDVTGLDAAGGRLVAIAASPTRLPGLLEVDLATGRWTHTPLAPCPLAPGMIRPPEALAFEGHGGRPTQAWFHPPAGGGDPRTPLLVRAHSGPTGMARTGLNLAIQFWTTRGWGVVDVNYGGSTGFGRAYRERLDGQWGVVDVADCAAAARAVVAAGRADPERVAMEGGSAAGFTVLAMLCFTDALRAGACRYAVADLAALASHGDHRFEARYLDGLVGPWPEAKAIYEARSPLQHAEHIRRPVIFFQGLEDCVVPPAQTEAMATALAQAGVPVEVRRFAGEGHGFRSQAVQVEVLEATEAFFRRHLGLA